jgi:putative PIN family toxin of toxin-antitoxin system
MRRVVIETSVAISAALKPDGVSNKALLFALFHCQPLVSPDTFSELERVLNKTKFTNKISDVLKTQFLATILARSVMINPVSRIHVCRDVNDDMFVNLAIDSNAQTIVTRSRSA